MLNLLNIILNTWEKIRKRGDVCTDTLNYFLIKDAKFARFYLLPKIHKRLHNVPGRPVISNCRYYIENISLFLDFHLQPIAIKVKLYIKDTNDFLKKLRSLTNLPGNSLLCTMDVVGLYPNIPHDEGLSALRKRLNERDKKDVSTDTPVELAELLLKNNIFNVNERPLKQKRGTTAKPYLWWRYIVDIFFILEHGEEKLRDFVQTLNEIHPTIKLTAEWSH